MLLQVFLLLNSYRLQALVEELFECYFTQEKWLTKEVCAAAAEKVGIPNAAEFLADDSAGVDKVKEQLKMAQRVSGVPHFIVQQEQAVSGGQPPEVFEEIFSQYL